MQVLELRSGRTGHLFLSSACRMSACNRILKISAKKRGIYIEGDGSYSIDQQRYNFQFGGQVFWEIKDGKRTRMLRDVAYQARTPNFWNSMSLSAAKALINLADRSATARASRSN